ncbi:MAG: hypothetical protein K8G79_05130 [bacterium]|uniref:Uncharacterized protein n=1 Tax=Candidatus Methylomirabilis tolerans TaxID=3123416 RepID=A0AAJ1AHD5_9BACT|nr:hypothetical protein [Candidatus Methylomirabilis sp.]
MPGAEFNVDLLVYTSLITLGFVTFVLGFVWGFAKFILPLWLEEKAPRAGKLRLVQGLRKAA